MSVVLLTNPSKKGRALAHLLLRRGLELSHVVFQSAPSPTLRQRVQGKIRGGLRRLGELATGPDLGRQVEALERPFRERAEARLEAYLEEHGLTSSLPRHLRQISTKDINSCREVADLRALEPELFVVWGTGILRPNVFQIPSLGTLNAHTSILPYYRGTRSEFWQCYLQDYDHVGVTFHFIDAGVDTGRICRQVKQEVVRPREPHALRNRNSVLVFEHYPEVAELVLSRELEPFEQPQAETKTYRWSEITPEKCFELYTRCSKHERIEVQ